MDRRFKIRLLLTVFLLGFLALSAQEDTSAAANDGSGIGSGIGGGIEREDPRAEESNIPLNIQPQNLEDAPSQEGENQPIQDDNSENLQAFRASGAGWDDIFQIILVLGFVIATIYGVFYFLKKMSKSSLIQDSTIQVISSKGIGTNKALHVVSVGNQYFLIGSGSHEIHKISELTDKETIDKLQLEESMGKPASASFSELFGKIFSGPQKQKSEYLSKQRDRIEELKP
jgi:flagellar biosynthetic protein FliO